MIPTILEPSRSSSPGRRLGRVVLAIFLSLLTGLLASTAAYTQDCRDYADHLRWVTKVPVAEGPQRAAVKVSLLAIACDEAGLRLFDFADREAPQFLGEIDTPGLATAVAVAGNHLLVADYLSGL